MNYIRNRVFFLKYFLFFDECFIDNQKEKKRNVSIKDTDSESTIINNVF